MGIVLESILAVTPAGVRGVVRHEEQLLEVEVHGSGTQIASIVGVHVNVEFTFSAVTAWRRLKTDNRDAHGLFAAEAGAVRVVGVAHDYAPDLN